MLKKMVTGPGIGIPNMLGLPTGIRRHTPNPIGLHFDDDEGAGGGNDDEEEPEFTPAQQKKLNKLIDEAHAKGMNKGSAKLQKELDAIKQKMLDDAKKTGGKDGKDAKFTQEDLNAAISEALKEPSEKLTEMQKREEASKAKERNAAIISAASKADAVNPTQLAKLVADNVVHDEDGEIVVLRDNGKPWLSKKGEPITVDDFVLEFLADKANAHLKKGSGKAGSGSSSQNNGKGSKTPQGAPKTPAQAQNHLTNFFAKHGRP